MNYITFNELIEATKATVKSLKSTYTGIISITRSGHIPAVILSHHLNIPVYTINEFVNGIQVTNFTKRPLGLASTNKYLVVDDSINTGGRILQSKQSLSKHIDCGFEYMCIYATEQTANLVDYFADIIPQPRIFEWNVFNHSILSNSCLDIDGVVCPDPELGKIDEVKNEKEYIDFITNTKPIRTIKVPIKSFITSRMEKYRAITEFWLKEHGFQYESLHMCQYSNASERRIMNRYAEDKAEIYDRSNACLMIESSDYQAKKINQITGKPVLCTDINKLYAKKKVKLEIGPGSQSLGPDWYAMDMIKRNHVQIVHDVRNLPFPIRENTFDIVYMSHILEHIPWFQTTDFLKEVKRILKVGGVVEIWVPDLKKLVSAYLNPDLVSNDNWYKYNPEKHPTKWFNGRIFTYGPGEENWHRAAFDEEFLAYNLKSAGFSDIKKLKKPRGYDHGWINLGMRGCKQTCS